MTQPASRTTIPSLPVSIEHRARVASTVLPVIRTARPHQWIKNLVLFGPAAIAGRLVSVPTLTSLLIGVVAFSAASSAVYLVNDIADAEADRRHPTKRLRPIASGQLTPERAGQAAAVCIGLGVGLALGISGAFAWCILAYLGLSVGYSHGLKRVPVVDALSVAAGFAVRFVAGSVTVAIPLSVPFLTLVGTGAMFVSIGKRVAELDRLANGAAAHRRVLGWYRKHGPRGILATSEALLALAALWALADLAPDPVAVALTLAVVAAAERFRRVIDAGDGEDPSRLLLRDPFLRAIAGSLVIAVAVAGQL